jgi:antitoxin component of MazEF toxin-antitoxin module
MKRKLVKVGNSLAVTLPKDLVEEFRLRPGMPVETAVDPRDGSFVVRPGTHHFEEGHVTPRFRRAVANLVKRRGAVYRRLA